MRRATMIIGAALVLVGVRELVDGASLASLRATLVWFVGGVVLHDGLLVPVTLVTGLLLTRFVPGTYRGLVQGALVVSATATLALLPLLSGRGRTPDNPSQQPLDYGRNLALVLAAVWLLTAALALVRRVRRNDHVN